MGDRYASTNYIDADPALEVAKLRKRMQSIRDIVPITGRAGVYGNRTTGVAANQVRWDSRKQWILRGDVVEIFAEWLGFYTDTTGVEIANGNNQTIAHALEYGATVKRHLFAGANTGTIVSGSTILRSDPLYAADFGLAYFPDGSTIWGREERSVALGQNVNRFGSARSYAGEKTYTSDGLAASQLLATGVMALPSGGTTFEICASPWRLVGRLAGTPKDSLVVLGDSLGAGEDDQWYGLSSHGDDGGGWFGRSCYGAGLAFANLAVSGTKASQFITSMAAKREMLRGYDHHLIMFGTNDGVAVGKDATFLDIQMIVAMARSCGARSVTLLTLPPRSTGSWATPAAQVRTAGWEAGGAFRDPLNNLIRASVGMPGGPDYVFDFGRLCEHPNVYDAWGPDYTNDGTHPLQSTITGIIKPAFDNLLSRILAT